MTNPDDLKQLVSQLKERLNKEKDSIQDIDTLVKKKIERDAGIWEYSFDELEHELFERFSFLEEKSDCLSFEEISSPRKGIGWFITLGKKILKKITNPYSRMILSKQYQFNKELVPIHLASILSLQKIKDRLNELEDVAKKILDIQEEILEDRNEQDRNTNKY
ncbi:MAG: hypothetical protein MUP98_09035 [Candidatus Aminicenantes bacterium]|nr:hypothetical protein [Candidatus Aminicenantes bacterium]